MKLYEEIAVFPNNYQTDFVYDLPNRALRITPAGSRTVRSYHFDGSVSNKEAATTDPQFGEVMLRLPVDTDPASVLDLLRVGSNCTVEIKLQDDRRAVR